MSEALTEQSLELTTASADGTTETNQEEQQEPCKTELTSANVINPDDTIGKNNNNLIRKSPISSESLPAERDTECLPTLTSPQILNCDINESKHESSELSPGTKGSSNIGCDIGDDDEGANQKVPIPPLQLEKLSCSRAIPYVRGQPKCKESTCPNAASVVRFEDNFNAPISSSLDNSDGNSSLELDVVKTSPPTCSVPMPTPPEESDPSLLTPTYATPTADTPPTLDNSFTTTATTVSEKSHVPPETSQTDLLQGTLLVDESTQICDTKGENPPETILSTINAGQDKQLQSDSVALSSGTATESKKSLQRVSPPRSIDEKVAVVDKAERLLTRIPSPNKDFSGSPTPKLPGTSNDSSSSRSSSGSNYPTNSQTRKGNKIPVGIAIAWQRLVTTQSNTMSIGSTTTSTKVTSAPSTMSRAEREPTLPKTDQSGISSSCTGKVSQQKVELLSSIKVPSRPSSASPVGDRIRLSSPAFSGKELACKDDKLVKRGLPKSHHNLVQRRIPKEGKCSTPELLNLTSSVSVTSRPIPSSSVPPNLGLGYLSGHLPLATDYQYGVRSITPYPGLTTGIQSYPSGGWSSSADLSVPQGYSSAAAAAYLQQSMQTHHQQTHLQMELRQQIVHQTFNNYPEASSYLTSRSYDSLRHQYEQIIMQNHQDQQTELLRQYHLQHFNQQQQQQQTLQYHQHQQEAMRQHLQLQQMQQVQQQTQHFQQHQQQLLLTTTSTTSSTSSTSCSSIGIGGPSPDDRSSRSSVNSDKNRTTPTTKICIPLLSPSPTGGVRTPTPNSLLQHHSLSHHHHQNLQPYIQHQLQNSSFSLGTLPTSTWPQELYHQNSSTILSPKSLTSSSSPSPVTVQSVEFSPPPTSGAASSPHYASYTTNISSGQATNSSGSSTPSGSNPTVGGGVLPGRKCSTPNPSSLPCKSPLEKSFSSSDLLGLTNAGAGSVATTGKKGSDANSTSKDSPKDRNVKNQRKREHQHEDQLYNLSLSTDKHPANDTEKGNGKQDVDQMEMVIVHGNHERLRVNCHRDPYEGNRVTDRDDHVPLALHSSASKPHLPLTLSNEGIITSTNAKMAPGSSSPAQIQNLPHQQSKHKHDFTRMANLIDKMDGDDEDVYEAFDKVPQEKANACRSRSAEDNKIPDHHNLKHIETTGVNKGFNESSLTAVVKVEHEDGINKNYPGVVGFHIKDVSSMEKDSKLWPKTESLCQMGELVPLVGKKSRKGLKLEKTEKEGKVKKERSKGKLNLDGKLQKIGKKISKRESPDYSVGKSTSISSKRPNTKKERSPNVNSGSNSNTGNSRRVKKQVNDDKSKECDDACTPSIIPQKEKATKSIVNKKPVKIYKTKNSVPESSLPVENSIQSVKKISSSSSSAKPKSSCSVSKSSTKEKSKASLLVNGKGKKREGKAVIKQYSTSPKKSTNSSKKVSKIDSKLGESKTIFPPVGRVGILGESLQGEDKNLHRIKSEDDINKWNGGSISGNSFNNGRDNFKTYTNGESPTGTTYYATQSTVSSDLPPTAAPVTTTFTIIANPNLIPGYSPISLNTLKPSGGAVPDASSKNSTSNSNSSPVTLLLPRILPTGQTFINSNGNITTQQTINLVVSSQDIQIPAYLSSPNLQYLSHSGYTPSSTLQPGGADSQTLTDNTGTKVAIKNPGTVTKTFSNSLSTTLNHATPCDTFSNVTKPQPSLIPARNNSGSDRLPDLSPVSSTVQQQSQAEPGYNRINEERNNNGKSTLHSTIPEQKSIFARKEFIMPGEDHLNLLATVAQEFGTRDDLGKLSTNFSIGSQPGHVTTTYTNSITTSTSIRLNSGSTDEGNFCSSGLPSSICDGSILPKDSAMQRMPRTDSVPLALSQGTPSAAKYAPRTELPFESHTSKFVTSLQNHGPRPDGFAFNTTSKSIMGNPVVQPQTPYDEYEYNEKEQVGVGRQEVSHGPGYSRISKKTPPVLLKIPQVIPKAVDKVQEKLRRKQEKAIANKSVKNTDGKVKKPKIGKKKRDNLLLVKEWVEKSAAVDNHHQSISDTIHDVSSFERGNEGELKVAKLKIPKIKKGFTENSKTSAKSNHQERRSMSPEKAERKRIKIQDAKIISRECHEHFSEKSQKPGSMKMTLPIPKVAKIRIKLSETQEPTLMRHYSADSSFKVKSPGKNKVKRRYSDGEKESRRKHHNASPTKKHKHHHKSHGYNGEDELVGSGDDDVLNNDINILSKAHKINIKCGKSPSFTNPRDDLPSSFASLTPPLTTKALAVCGSSESSHCSQSKRMVFPTLRDTENETETENENENEFTWVADPKFAVSAIRLGKRTTHSEDLRSNSSTTSTSSTMLTNGSRVELKKSAEKSLKRQARGRELDGGVKMTDLKAQLKSLVNFAPKRVKVSRPAQRHHHIKPCLKAEPVVRPLSSISGDDDEDDNNNNDELNVEDNSSDAEINLEVASLTKSISSSIASSFYKPHVTSSTLVYPTPIKKGAEKQVSSLSRTTTSTKRRRASSNQLSKSRLLNRRFSLNLETLSKSDDESEEEELLDIDGDYPASSASTSIFPFSTSRSVQKTDGTAFLRKTSPRKRCSRSSTLDPRISQLRCGGQRDTSSSNASAGTAGQSCSFFGDVEPAKILVDETMIPGKIELESVEELLDEMRILTEIQGLFYTGKLNALQPPDVYGVTLDNERGAPPHLIFSAEEVLEKCIKEKKPQTLKVGLRICAYWSPQYSGLYPGRVSTDFNPKFDPEEDLIPIEFDDGDTGMIKLGEIRLLPANHPIREYDPNPLLTLEKKHRKRRHSSANTNPGGCTGDHEEADCGESYCAKVAKLDLDEEEEDERNDKDGHHSFKSLYWTWTGLGYKHKRNKSKKNRNKEFFRGIQRGDEIINVGDSAIFISHGNERPYIGRVERFWEKKGQKIVNVRWFYHPEEVKSPKRIPHLKHPGALFESPHIDENDVQTIAKKCDVLPLKEFKERIGRMPKLSLKNSNSTSTSKPKDLYYVAGYYDPYTYNLQLKI